jgi:hypothetical protein
MGRWGGIFPQGILVKVGLGGTVTCRFNLKRFRCQRFVVRDCGNDITREILDRLIRLRRRRLNAATRRMAALSRKSNALASIFSLFRACERIGSSGLAPWKWQVVETGPRVYAFRQ